MSRASSQREGGGPIALAEKIMALLDEGRFTATYKYAVLLALIDLSLEKTEHDGAPPEMIVTPELAQKVIELYWPHSVPYPQGSEASVLLQNAARPGVQARILKDIQAFRTRTASQPSAQLARARSAAPKAYRRLMRKVEWTLIDMPLPRLQQFGHGYEPFLYSISWGKKPPKAPFTAHYSGDPSDFDNRIHFVPGVAADLVLLNGLLRPLIHREWARQVARINGLEESRLEAFLFGIPRVALGPIAAGLQELQDDCCFYCGDRIERHRRLGPQVDHFIPWSRYPNNAVENLVVAHERCNSHKSDFLAASGHVERWRSRIAPGSRSASDLLDLARAGNWETDPDRSLGVARGIYMNLPRHVPLWVLRDRFDDQDPDQLAQILM